MSPTPRLSGAGGITPLRLESVSKSYGRQQVLRGVSLSVEPGELMALVGPNGAGKSTLMKTVLDFSSADAGSIHIHGIAAGDRQARADLAFLPEQFLPPYFLRGREFLSMMAAFYGKPLSHDELTRLLAAVDLSVDALAKPVRALSKGMAQKLGLAAVLGSGKSLLILDEPMSGLDPKARALIKQSLMALKRDGRSVFFSTHLLADVEALCDRLAVLDGGEVKFLGTPAEFRERHGGASLENAYLACVG